MSQSFMLSLKYDHHFLCEFSILFSTVKLRLGYNFSQFIHRFKTWIFKRWSWAAKFFPIHERHEKLGFSSSLGCTSKFFSVYYKV